MEWESGERGTIADKQRGYGRTERTGTPLPLMREVADAKMEALQERTATQVNAEFCRAMFLLSRAKGCDCWGEGVAKAVLMQQYSSISIGE